MRVEVWSRPGAATFERIWEDPQPIKFGGTERVSGVGDGSMSLPDTADTVELADLLCLTDPDTPANSTRALIRVYADGDVGGTDPPLHEWRVSSVLPPRSDTDWTWEASGKDPFDFLNDAETKPWDWDGTDDFVSLFPDWIWGGRNLVGEIQSVFRPHTISLYTTTGTTGTFTIGVSFDGGAYQYTGNISVSATPAQIDAALTLLANVTAVSVDGEGTEDNPWRIQFLVPEGNYTIAMNTGGLSGGTGYFDIDEYGEELPKGWEESYSYVSNLPHGFNTIFRLSDGSGSDPALPACDDSGWSIAFNGTEPYFPGIQKPVKVKPGGIYQASVWVYSQGANTDLRFVIRDLYENGIAATPDFSSGTTIISNTWTQMTIANVAIPASIDEVLFRIGHVGTGDPPTVFVACPEFNEGLPANTIGGIWELLYDDATTNHSGDGRIVWEDESASLPDNLFLVLDFTDALDSDGAAWDDPLVSLTAKRGFSYGRVMKETIKLGYETRIVPAATDGQWKLQIYNPGTLGTDYTGDDFVGIKVGREVTRKALRRFVPTGTQVMVESGNQAFSIAADTNAITALGRIERYSPERDLGTLLETGLAADRLLAQLLARGRSIQPVVLPGPDDPTPFVDYLPGDTLDIEDPDESTTTTARLVALSYSVKDGLTTYEPALSAETFVGNNAVSQGVRQLLEAQDAIRREPPEDSPDTLAQEIWGGTGTPTFVIAASNSSEFSKTKADFVCDGVDDEVEINAAITFVFDGTNYAKCRIVLCEGDFYIGNPIVPHIGTHIMGFGRDATIIHLQNSADCNGIQPTWITANQFGVRLEAFALDGNEANNTSGSGIWAASSANNYRYCGFVCNNIYAYNWAEHGFAGSGSLASGIYTDCWAYNNGDYGFYAVNGGSFYDQCWAEENDYGFVSAGANPTEWHDCHAHLNTNDGFNQSVAEKSLIVGCHAHQNSGHGIKFGGAGNDGHHSTVTGNSCHLNGGDGIHFEYSFEQGGDHTIIAGNMCSENTGWGVNVTDASYIHVAANATLNNTAGCINLGPAARNNTAAANSCTPTGGAGAGQDSPGVDSTAIHDNIAAEISAIATKTTPTVADYLLIEDAADSDNKKKITIEQLAALVAGLIGESFIAPTLVQQLATGIAPTVTPGPVDIVPALVQQLATGIDPTVTGGA